MNSRDRAFDVIHEQIRTAKAEDDLANVGALAIYNVDAVLHALQVASNVQEQGLRADLDCGHVVPEDQVVTCEDDAEICRACAEQMPGHLP